MCLYLCTHFLGVPLDFRPLAKFDAFLNASSGVLPICLNCPAEPLTVTRGLPLLCLLGPPVTVCPNPSASAIFCRSSLVVSKSLSVAFLTAADFFSTSACLGCGFGGSGCLVTVSLFYSFLPLFTSFLPLFSS